MRIATELHDDIGASLASVQLYLQIAEKEEGKEKLIQSQQLINDTVNKVRSLSHRLQPAILLKSGLNEALQSFFDTFNTTGAIHIDYNTESLPEIDANIQLTLYRIVQELVNNTLKHAAASNAEVYIETADNSLSLRFSHNGQGITEETFNEYIYKKNATGLKNIINRLKVLNGTISFDKEKNWYHTIITIPL
jgi:signal transduction histidine kinase